MIEKQKKELKSPLTALGPMVANAPGSNEFAAVRVVTKITKILAQIALQDAASPAPPPPGRGILRHIKGPGVKP